MEAGRERRPPPGEIEQPVQDQHVLPLDHQFQQRTARVLGDAHVKLDVMGVDGVAERRVVRIRGLA